MDESLSNLNTRKQSSERIKARKKMSKAQMQLAIIKKKQCDAKALMIVERLLEPVVEPRWLLQNLQHINKSHMEDVIEERSIVKLCGYVLCKNSLTVIITQKFHISTKRNKVYDVTRRKNFCSSHCYGACNYLLEQMLTSPLWLREKEEIPVFRLLPTNLQAERNMLGDEVFVGRTDILSEGDKECLKDIDEDEETRNQILDKDENTYDRSYRDDAKVADITSNERNSFEQTFNEESVCKNMEVEDSNTSNNNLNDDQDIVKRYGEATNVTTNNDNSNENNGSSNESADIYQKAYELPASSKNSIISSNCEKSKKVVTIGQSSPHEKGLSTRVEKDACENLQRIGIEKAKRNTSTKRIRKAKSQNSEQFSTKFYTLTMRVEKSVKEWVTEDTLSFLQGGVDVRFQLMETFTQRERYLQLCKKLNKLQLEDEKEDRADLVNNTLKPLPSYSVLREEANKLELKVRAFYEGRVVINPPEKVVEKNETNEIHPVLPLTDAHAPKALRRKIFLEKLDKILPDLLRMLAGTIQTYTITEYINNNSNYTLVKGLVNTFSLSASNIVFKTAEWTLVGLIIIKMLSIIDTQLKILLTTKQASMYISMVLMSYKLDSYYLDRLIIELTNNPDIFEIE